jgi:hypothetical protein
MSAHCAKLAAFERLLNLKPQSNSIFQVQMMQNKTSAIAYGLRLAQTGNIGDPQA